MKLITLNVWGGRVLDELLDFIKKYSVDTDFFCFQEMCHKDPRGDARAKKGGYGELFQAISNLLPDFQGIFQPCEGDTFGQACFVRRPIGIERDGSLFVYRERGAEIIQKDSSTRPRIIQYLSLALDEKRFELINFHGLWAKEGKVDTENREIQSQKIMDFIKTVKIPLVFCGDFNLNPDTKSLKVFEDYGMRNLVKDFGITNTRTKLYTRGAGIGYYADYVLVSPGIKVNEFRVLPDVVSDHAPLFLDFEVV